METSSGTNPDTYTNSSSTSSSTSNSRRYGFQFPALSFLQAPVSTLLEYSGILRPRSDHHETEGLIVDGDGGQLRRRLSDAGSASGNGEVSIRIIGAGEQGHVGFDESEEAIGQIPAAAGPRLDREGVDGGNGRDVSDGERVSMASSPSAVDTGNGDGGDGTAGGNSNRDSSYQRYDIQQVARWVEQILPFSLLLLVVFIRQHLQGIWFGPPFISKIIVCSLLLFQELVCIVGQVLFTQSMNCILGL